ncbi:MAG: S8 family serine peptidase [Calditrichaeota bacterium]|nr:S8 family serine peptidase [Calditrichota bacterium]
MRGYGFVLLLVISFVVFVSARDIRDQGNNSSASQNPDPNTPVVLSAQEPQYLPGVIVVKLKMESADFQYSIKDGKVQTAFADINEAIQKFNVHKIHQPFPPSKKFRRKTARADLTRIRYFYFDKSQDVLEVAKYFNQLPNVIYAEPLEIHYPLEVPNDPKYSKQWHFQNINAEAAWDLQHGDTTIIIAIIDTGVDLDHPDIQANLWTNPGEIPGNGIDDDGNGYIDDIHGWDFVGADINNRTPDGDPDQKYDSHGTHVAGIANAVTNNGLGIAGMAWNCRIMVTKHAPDAESTSIYYGYDGITYAAENGADIINCSWGSGRYSQYGQEIINYAYDLGALVVAAAGNDGPGGTYSPPDTPPPHYPSSYEHVLSVAATNSRDEITSWSYYGPTVDVAAPGEAIYSTIPSSSGVYDLAYGAISGTSMASPLVAGLAALVKSAFPDWGPDQITSQIINSADDISSIGKNRSYIEAGGYGSGRINAYKAISLEAKPQFEIVRIVYNDSLGGNGNLTPEPGETIDIIIYFKNTWGNATDVQINLGVSDYAVNLLDNNANVGDVPGGASIFNNKNDVFRIEILPDVLPHIVELQFTFSDANGFTQTFSKKFSIRPMVLFVDDDDGINNIESYYTEILDSLNIVYEYWEHVGKELPSDLLLKYPVVIWACEWTFPSLNQNDRDEIAKYLDSGGKLFISGQDIGWDLADPTGASVPNEYGRSNGASRTFYENYLRAEYISDQSQYNKLSGQASDPIGDGLSFSVYQPGRTSKQQFPSEVHPINGSVSIFNYPNGLSGAIRYSNGYRLVYFAFGGFEAIVEKSVRDIVMPRVINWLNGFSITHEPLKDTEDLTNSYPVIANVHSAVDSLVKIELYWNTQDQFPYQKIPMTEVEPGKYLAEIPPPQSPTDIHYFIYVESEKGTYAPIVKYKFHAGPDEVPPVITLISQPQRNTINLNQAFQFTIKAEDNIGIDTTTAKLHYWRAGQTEQVINMDFIGDNQFIGSFSVSPIEPRTRYIYYYFSINDISSNRNLAVSDTFFFSDTTELIDDFEENNPKWDLGKYWDYSSSRRHSGQRSISDSRIGKYKNNTRDSLTYLDFFDLRYVKSAWIDYYIRYDLERNKDFLYFQITPDSGQSWITLKEYTGRRGSFVPDTVYINQFTGEQYEHVGFRFLLVTDSTGTADGVYIDDISITVSNQKITSISLKGIPSIPEKYYLRQNFPNPFNPITTIEFGLPKNSEIRLEIFNILGQKIRILASGLYKPGHYKVKWDGRNDQGIPVPSGIYFYRLSTNNFVTIKKMILMR